MPVPPTIARKDLIITRERQRQEFDPVKLEELRQSIEDRGLLHAPVIRMQDGRPVLVAGESRIKAIDDLWALGLTLTYNCEVIPEGRLPYTTLGQLTRLEAEEAELDENLRRKDLTWQEEAAATARLIRLRAEQAEIAGRTLTPPQVIETVAKELHGSGERFASTGGAITEVRAQNLIASHLGNPLIAKAKSAQEALKILKQEERREANIALARTVGQTFDSSSHSLIRADCIGWLGQCDPEQFDVILTDPPYGMGADQFGDGGGKLGNATHHYDDSPESWRKLMAAWAPLSFRVAKPEAHAYVFCDFDRFHELKAMMQGAGWYVFRTPFIVVKQNSGRVPLPDRGPRRQWECLLYAIKGSKPVTHIYPDVITASADENLAHGAQKPVAVYQNLLQRSVKPGDKVLDCFAGTGTIFPAAHAFQCAATGIEQEEAYYGLAVKRLEALRDAETAGTAFLPAPL